MLALAFDRDNQLLASGSLDHTIRLWSVRQSGHTLNVKSAGTLKGHVGSVHALAFHPTERRLASGSMDRTIKIWDLDFGVEVATLRGHAGHVNDLAFDVQGERLLSASGGFRGSDNVARLWETGVEPEVRLRRANIKRAHDEVLRLFQTAIESLDDARTKIKLNRRLTAEVRATALAEFDNMKPRPVWLNRRANNILNDPETPEMSH